MIGNDLATHGNEAVPLLATPDHSPELAALDAAWSAGSGIAVVELIAPGGTGKTALVKRWLDGQRAAVTS